MNNLRETARFDDLFWGWVMRWDRERVKAAGPDEFGVGPGYYYSAGRYAVDAAGPASLQWRTLWVAPRQATLEQAAACCLPGQVQDIRLIRWLDGRVCVAAARAGGYARMNLVGRLTDMPEAVEEFLGVNRPAGEKHAALCPCDACVAKGEAYAASRPPLIARD